MAKRFGIGDFLIRFIFAVVLVLGTFNPSGKSYYHWVYNSINNSVDGIGSLLALAGVTLLIGWAVFLNTTFRALGTLGVVLGLAFFGCVVWALVQGGLISTEGSNIIAWIVLFVVAAILAVGMSWSHLRRTWSGQQDVDDIGEEVD
jgi:hypothetical protein